MRTWIYVSEERIGAGAPQRRYTLRPEGRPAPCIRVEDNASLPKR